MKKIIMTVLVCMLFALAIPTLAKPSDTYDPYAKNQGFAGNSMMYHAYLVEKDCCWNIVADGAWGKLTINFETGNFVFNGHDLKVCTAYTLIEYPKPQTTWPWPVNMIASGTSTAGGDIHLSGTFSFALGDYIWLVLTNDIVSSSMSGWHPNEYLFEYDIL